MEIICFLISCFAIAICVFLFWLEAKKIIDFSSILGIVITYLFDFLLIVFYFYFYLNFNKQKVYENIIVQQLYNNRFDIAIILFIILCNILTKFFLKNFCKIKDWSQTNRAYKIIMNAFVVTIGIVGIVCLDLDLTLTVALLLLGNNIDFSIHKDRCERINKKDALLFFGTIVTTVLLIFASHFGTTILKPYEKYFFIPWGIALIISLISIAILIIKKRRSK